MAPGTEIGGYRVLGPLGRGGTGSVYRAVDGGGDEVALKLLHPHLADDDDARERLRREVAALQRLRHPAIARVLDAEVDSSDAFVVTELVDGPDLGARVRADGPLEPAALLELAERTREALGVVHAAGVLHRDLSPGNVLLSSRGPVLIDFGIAQAAEDPRVTSTGLVVGTPGYLAPELLEGEDPSTTTDWWGWAAVLAFAATGRPPFGTRPVQAVLARVRSGEVDLAGLPAATAAALRRGLAVRPEHRASPEEVEADLRGALTGAAGGATEVLEAGHTSVLGPDDGADGADEADRTASLRTTDLAPTAVQDVGAPGHDATATVVAGEPYDDATATYGTSYDAAPYDGEAYDHDGDPAYDDDGDASHDADYDPALDDHDIPVTYLAPRPPRRAGTVLAAGVALTALGAGRPGLALALAVALAVVARAVGVAVGAVHARRARRGVRGSDVSLAVVGAPWYLLRGVLGVLPATLVAASTVVVLGGVAWWALGSGRWVVVSPPDGQPAGELPGNAPWVAWVILAAVTALGLVVLWFGPMMRTTRMGARWTLGALLPGGPATVAAVSVLLAGAVLVAALTAGERLDVDWWPLPGAPDLRDVGG